MGSPRLFPARQLRTLQRRPPPAPSPPAQSLLAGGSYTFTLLAAAAEGTAQASAGWSGADFGEARGALLTVADGVVRVDRFPAEPKKDRPKAEMSLWYKTAKLFLKDARGELSKEAWMAEYVKRRLSYVARCWHVKKVRASSSSS